jgi:hypothetical protein
VVAVDENAQITEKLAKEFRDSVYKPLYYFLGTNRVLVVSPETYNLFAVFLIVGVVLGGVSTILGVIFTIWGSCTAKRTDYDRI